MHYSKRGNINRKEYIRRKNLQMETMEMQERLHRMAVQRKTEIDAPDSVHEKQADEIGRKVANNENAADLVKNQSSLNASPQTKSESNVPEVTTDIQTKLDSTKGGGQNLDTNTKTSMEQNMGVDLSGVKIHTDNKANELSESINAKAFTHEQDVYFKQGNYNPESQSGKELLGHELAHTVQQNEGISGKLQREIDNPPWIDSAINYNKKQLTPYTWNAQYMNELMERLRDISGDLFHFEKAVNNEIGADFCYLVASAQKTLFPAQNTETNLLGKGDYDGKLGETTFREMFNYLYNIGHLREVPASQFKYPPDGLPQNMIHGIYYNMFVKKITNFDSNARLVYKKIGPSLTRVLLVAPNWDLLFTLAVNDVQKEHTPHLTPVFPGFLDDETILECSDSKQNQNTVVNAPLVKSTTTQVDQYSYYSEKSKLITDRNKFLDEEGKRKQKDQLNYLIELEKTKSELRLLVGNTYQNIIEILAEQYDYEEERSLENLKYVAFHTEKGWSNFDEAVLICRLNLGPLYMDFLQTEIPERVRDAVYFSGNKNDAGFVSYQDYNARVRADKEKNALSHMSEYENKLKSAQEKEITEIQNKYKTQLQKEIDDYINKRNPEVSAQLKKADFVLNDDEMNAFISLYVDLQKPTDKLTVNQQKIVDDYKNEIHLYKNQLAEKYENLMQAEIAPIQLKYTNMFNAERDRYSIEEYNRSYYVPQNILNWALKEIKGESDFNKEFEDKRKLVNKYWPLVEAKLPWNQTSIQMPKEGASEQEKNDFKKNYKLFSVRDPIEREAALASAKAEYYQFVLNDLSVEKDAFGNVKGPSVFMLKTWATDYEIYLGQKADYWNGIASPKGMGQAWARGWGVIPYDQLMAGPIATRYNDARRNLQTLINKPEGDEYWKNFVAGMKSNDPQTLMPILGTIVEAGKNFELSDIAQRVQSHGELTESEFLLWESYVALQQLNQMIPNTAMYSFGSMVLPALKYMAEFALTKGAFTSGEVAVGSITAGLVERKVISLATQKVLKYLAGTIVQTIANPQAVFQAISVEMLPTGIVFYENGEMEFLVNEVKTFSWEVFAKGFATAASSFATERLGGHILALPRKMAINFLIKNPKFKDMFFFRWLIGNVRNKSLTIDDLILMKNNNTLSAFITKEGLVDKFRATFGAGKIIEEYIEELLDNKVGDVIHGRDPFTINWSDELATLLTVAFVSGPVQVGGLIQTLGSNKVTLKITNTEKNIDETYSFDKSLITAVDTLAEKSDNIDTEALRKTIEEWKQKNPNNTLSKQEETALNAYYAQGAGKMALASWAYGLTGEEGNIEGYKALISMRLGRALTVAEMKGLAHAKGGMVWAYSALMTARMNGVGEDAKIVMGKYFSDPALTEDQLRALYDRYVPLLMQHKKNFTAEMAEAEGYLFVKEVGFTDTQKQGYALYKKGGESNVDLYKRLKTIEANGISVESYMDNYLLTRQEMLNRPDASKMQTPVDHNKQAGDYLPQVQTPGIVSQQFGQVEKMALQGERVMEIMKRITLGLKEKGEADIGGKRKGVKRTFNKHVTSILATLTDPNLKVEDKKTMALKKLAKVEKMFKHQLSTTNVDFDAIRTLITSLDESNFGNRYVIGENNIIEGTTLTLDQLKQQVADVNAEMEAANFPFRYMLDIKESVRKNKTTREVILKSVGDSTFAVLQSLDADALQTLEGLDPATLKEMADVIGSQPQKANELLKYEKITSAAQLQKRLNYVEEVNPKTLDFVRTNGKPKEVNYWDVFVVAGAHSAKVEINATAVNVTGRAVLTIEYNTDAKEIIIDRIFVPEGMPYIESGDAGIVGSKIPMQNYMYLTAVSALEKKGIKMNNQNNFVMKNIVNIDTIAHLAWLKKKYPNQSENELIFKTGTVLRTGFNLSHFNVTYNAAKVKGGKSLSLKRYIDKLSSDDAIKFRKLATQYNLKGTDIIHYGFDIIVTPK